MKDSEPRWKRNLKRKKLLLAATLLSALGSGLTGGIFGDQDPRPDLNADRLRTGSFTYRTLVDGRAAGESRIGVHRQENSGNFVFSNLVTGSFSQSWEAIASPTFAPVSAKLSLGEGAAARPVFELAYNGNRVVGFVVARKEPSKKREVSEAVSDDTVDQRIDWAAVMALKEYVEGQKFRFHVYDPGTGNSPMTVQVGESETTAVPAGSFDTVHLLYQITKNNGAESYEVFITKQAPRFLVKETFPNGSVSELVEK
jgi:hypothetical protein